MRESDERSELGVQQIIQTRIAAQQDLDAIIYGERALKAMGGREWGMTAEYGAADWALAQWAAAKAAAARFGEDLTDSSAGWNLRKAKKAAQAALAEAKAAEKALGTKKQLRLALAA